MLPLRILSLIAVGLVALSGIAFASNAAISRGRAKAHAKPSFRISGQLTGQLRPGAAMRLDLTVINPHRFPIAVTRLRTALSIDPAHAKAGCSARNDFFVTQPPAKARAVRIRPRAKLRLASVRGRSPLAVGMRNLPRNQDACQGAQIKLRYTGTARKVSR